MNYTLNLKSFSASNFSSNPTSKTPGAIVSPPESPPMPTPPPQPTPPIPTPEPTPAPQPDPVPPTIPPQVHHLKSTNRVRGAIESMPFSQGDRGRVRLTLEQ
jgi:hypothetical protein